MKFIVRDGFVCQVETKDEQGNVITNVYPGGKPVDFDAAEAEKHRHKLEPVDKAAAQFLEAGFVVVAPPAAAPAATEKTAQ